MEVMSTQNYYGGKDYTLISNKKELQILFGGTLDLYIRLTSPNLGEELGCDNFEITKENYEIYSLFDELYKTVKECNLYEVDEFDLMWCDSEEEIKDLYDRKKELNDDLRKRDVYKNIYDGKSIIWYSDEYIHDETEILKITKEEDKYILEFQEQKIRKNMSEGVRSLGSICIRFRNSGSYQDPFNTVFMKMYNELQKYDPNYHQMHIEEYVYQKKIGKIKASNNN